jgi:hypothetical protein
MKEEIHSGDGKTMKRFHAALSLLLLFSSSAAAAGSSSAGTLLRIPISVRASGMGEAYVAADDDVLGIHYNPAASLTSKQLAFLYQRGNLEDSIGAIGGGAPLSFGKVAGSLLYYDAGAITLTDTLGNSRTVTAQRDLLATASASLSPSSDLSVGGNLKFLRSQLVDEFTGTAFLLDLGTIYKPSSWLSLGFAAQNLGSALSYAGTQEELPKILRGGVALKKRRFAHHYAFAFDILTASDETTPKEHIGFEYSYAKLFALRLGYKAGYDTENLSFGAGFSRDIVSVDIAFVPSAELGTTVKTSLTLRF